MSKKFVMIIGVLLVVVVIFWIGITVYDTAVNVEVNPNAESHLKRITPSFDLEIIEEITVRTKVLPVSPRVIQELEYTRSSESLINGENPNEADSSDGETNDSEQKEEGSD